MRIPFNKASLSGREVDYVLESVAGGHISGDGPFTHRCQQLLEERLGAARVFLTTSCSDALELSALLLDIQAGDEVIVPSFTFVSTANAFALRGAKIVFCDIRPDTINLDESLVEGLVTSRTRAIVPVHYAGVGCAMDVISEISSRHELAIVEDNAHGMLGRYQGRLLGSFGQVSTLSFHETKNLTCGEGGAIVINDRDLVERAEIHREKGTNRSRFFRGQVDKYTWVDLGSSFLPSDMLAAFLLAQLERVDVIQAARRRLWENYDRALGDWAASVGALRPHVPDSCEQSYHMYYMLLPSESFRAELIAHLKQRGVHSVFHYVPLHTSPMGEHFGGRRGDCPVTEDISDRLLRLPFYNSLSEIEQNYVIESILQFDPS